MIADDLSPLWISVKTSAAATLLAFVTGISAAHIMSRYRGRLRPLWDGLLTLPLVLPPTVIGFFLLLIFGRSSVIGRALEQIGITVAFSWPATVIAATVVAFPLMYRATLGAFEQVNPNLLDAARTLGAGEWRVFVRVLVPLAWPGIMAGTVLAFARALGEFGATLMLAGNIPGRTQTMPIAIFFAAEGGNMNRALAWVLLIVALSLAIIAGLNYWGSLGRRRAPVASPDLERAPLPPIHITQTRAPGARTSTLEIDIQKALGTFQLSIASTTRGGIAGLLGASGSGKSLTLRCIAGLELPERGRVAVNGRVLFDAAGHVHIAPAQRRIGFVFQDYALFPHLTVAQNIAFGLERWREDERRQRIAQWAQVVQLTPFLDRFPHQLSGGQRQRVALARALAIEPELLLLDEPFSALDPHLRRQLEDELHEILSRFDGVTLLVTHDRDEAFRFCERLFVLSDGRVVSQGATRELFDDPGTLAAARLTGCKNLAPARAIASNAVHVENWGCTLQVGQVVDSQIEYAGIRAHDVLLSRDSGGENTFPCWLMERIDSPFEVTLYLRLHAPPQDGDCAHVEAEMPRDGWKELADWPQPWYAQIPAERILLLKA